MALQLWHSTASPKKATEKVCPSLMVLACFNVDLVCWLQVCGGEQLCGVDGVPAVGDVRGARPGRPAPGPRPPIQGRHPGHLHTHRSHHLHLPLR